MIFPEVRKQYCYQMEYVVGQTPAPKTRVYIPTRDFCLAVAILLFNGRCDFEDIHNTTKIPRIKDFRTIASFGLKEAKEAIEGAYSFLESVDWNDKAVYEALSKL